MVGFLCHFMPVCQAGSGYFPGPVHLEAEVRFLGRESGGLGQSWRAEGSWEAGGLASPGDESALETLSLLGESLLWESVWFCGKSVALGFLVASVCRWQGGCGFRGNLLFRRMSGRDAGRGSQPQPQRGVTQVASLLNSQTFPSEIPE